MRKLIFSFLFIGIFMAAANAKAGEGRMFLSSGFGTYQANKDYTTRVMINSGGSPGINAGEAVIRFDPKKVQLKAVSTNDSIFKLWPTQPKYDNIKGEIAFQGGNFAAYKGSAGEVLNFTFRAKSTGKIKFNISTSTEETRLMSAEEYPQDVLKERRESVMVIGSLADVSGAKALAQKLAGRILLQVEGNGEAWYMNPNDKYRYFLGRPADAFNIMRKLGLGVKHSYMTSNTVFPVKMSGRILLDVEDSGKAYYIYPGDRKAYYLGRPQDAFKVMREKGMGAGNETLYKLWDWAI